MEIRELLKGIELKELHGADVPGAQKGEADKDGGAQGDAGGCNAGGVGLQIAAGGHNCPAGRHDGDPVALLPAVDFDKQSSFFHGDPSFRV